jgi:hypothetical protein
MILYYRLMTKWSGSGDSMELSRMGLSQMVYGASPLPLLLFLLEDSFKFFLVWAIV